MRNYCLLCLSLLLSGFALASNVTTIPVVGRHGMVVSEQKLASIVGKNILQHGGNAIDAAVAVGYALAVVEPCCGNIGGGGFMVVHTKRGKNIFLNFREKSPAAIKASYFLKNHERQAFKLAYGYLPVGVPGTVMGLNYALKEYGTMSLKKVMAPAIAFARNGFVLSRSQANRINSADDRFKLAQNTRDIFLPYGKKLRAGEQLVQDDLANTLTAIAQGGTKAFYRGDIAHKLAADMHENGGVMTLDDLRHYTVTKGRPLTCHYRGYTIYSARPPSSGGVTLCEALNIVEGYPLSDFGYLSAEAIHYQVEALRYAFADRNHHLGDPAFVNNPLRKLLSKKHIKAIREQIKVARAGNSKQLGLAYNSPTESMNTSHFSVVDNKGNAVALTYTLNYFYGAGVVPGDLGFLLNNEMDDFSLGTYIPNAYGLISKGAPNIIEPNKRPLSSMSPTIVTKNGKVVMVLGAVGGSSIISTVFNTIINVIDFKMPITKAVDAPRLHMQWMPDVVYYEPGALSKEVKHTLRRMGYVLQEGWMGKSKTWGVEEAIYRDPKADVWVAGSDHRRREGGAAAW